MIIPQMVEPLAPEELWDEEGYTVWIPYSRYPAEKLRGRVRYHAFMGRGLQASMSDIVDNLTELRVTIEWMREDPYRPLDDPWFMPCTRFDKGAVKFWKVTAE